MGGMGEWEGCVGMEGWDGWMGGCVDRWEDA